MNDHQGGPDHEGHQFRVHEVRRRLSEAVDGVEPRPDALPRLLSAARRRRSPRRPLIAVVAAGAAAVVAVVATTMQDTGQRQPQPVSVAPNSYVAQPRPGVISSFDVGSGEQLHQLARTPAPGGTLAADRDRVYVAVQRGGEQGIVEIHASGDQRVVEPMSQEHQVNGLAAGGGRVAYATNGVVVVGEGARQRRLPVPPGDTVLDLAVGDDGRVAVLTRSEPGPTQVHVVGAGETQWSERASVPTPGDCGALAIEWTGPELAALSSVDCAVNAKLRVSTFDPGNGEQIGAGVPFVVAPHRIDPQGVQLSTDRLGRFLVSASGTPQWLVDGGEVSVLPAPCTKDGDSCAAVPSTLWG